MTSLNFGALESLFWYLGGLIFTTWVTSWWLRGRLEHQRAPSPSPDLVPSSWVPPQYPSKIIDSQTYSPDHQKSEKVAQGSQKATKQTSKSQLDITQFTKYVEK